MSSAGEGHYKPPWLEQGEAASIEHTLLWPPVLQKPQLFEVKAGWLELLQFYIAPMNPFAALACGLPGHKHV